MRTKTNEIINRQNVTVFYTIPRANIHFEKQPLHITLMFTESQVCVPYVSLSLYRYLYELLQKVKQKDMPTHVNFYSSIYTQIQTRPDIFKTYSSVCIGNNDTNISPTSTISKIHFPQQTPDVQLENAFFEYIEMYQILYLHDSFSAKYGKQSDYSHEPVQYMYFGNHQNCTQYLRANQFLRKRFSMQDNHQMYTNRPPLQLFTNPIQHSQPADFVFIDGTTTEESPIIGSEEYQLSINSLLFFILSLTLQKPNSTMIMRLSECFAELTVDVIYLISSFYERTFMMKPTICYVSSGVRYLVCKKFRGHINNATISQLHDLFLQVCKNNCKDRQIRKILQCSIPYVFIGKIEEVNSILNQPRLEFIHQRINQFENNVNYKGKIKPVQIPSSVSHVKHPSTYEIKKCIEWCSRFRIPLHPSVLQWYHAKPNHNNSTSQLPSSTIHKSHHQSKNWSVSS